MLSGINSNCRAYNQVTKYEYRNPGTRQREYLVKEGLVNVALVENGQKEIL